MAHLIGVSHRPLGVDIEPRDVLAPPDLSHRLCRTFECLRQRKAEALAHETHAKLYGNAAQVAPDNIETFMDGDRATLARSTSTGRKSRSTMATKSLCGCPGDILGRELGDRIGLAQVRHQLRKRAPFETEEEAGRRSSRDHRVHRPMPCYAARRSFRGEAIGAEPTFNVKPHSKGQFRQRLGRGA